MSHLVPTDPNPHIITRDVRARHGETVECPHVASRHWSVVSGCYALVDRTDAIDGIIDKTLVLRCDTETRQIPWHIILLEDDQ